MRRCSAALYQEGSSNFYVGPLWSHKERIDFMDTIETTQPNANLNGNWQGYFVGTNRGLVWLQIQHHGNQLVGSGNFSDFDFGQTTFELHGDVLQNRVSAILSNLRGGSGVTPNQVRSSWEILNQGSGLSGSWESDVGTSGAVVFSRVPESIGGLPPALYSKPVDLRAYKLDGRSFAGLLEIAMLGMFSKPIF